MSAMFLSEQAKEKESKDFCTLEVGLGYVAGFCCVVFNFTVRAETFVLFFFFPFRRGC